MALDGKYIGLILAISSSVLIGVSFVITKIGLQRARSDEYGSVSWQTSRLAGI